MTSLPAVALASLLLEHENFLGPQLIDDLAGHARIGNQWRADLDFITATDEQHVGQGHLVAHCAGQPFDSDDLAFGDSILLATRPNYGIFHGIFSSGFVKEKPRKVNRKDPNWGGAKPLKKPKLDEQQSVLTGAPIIDISLYDTIAMRYMPLDHKSPDFQAMAELRYQIRRFLRFSEKAARDAGIEPQQHQLLMAVRGLPDGLKPTVGVLAERMQLQHHSTVELIDRLVERGFLCRLRGTDDRRQVLVKLTRDGEQILEQLTMHHLQEWQSAGPTFVRLLQSIIEGGRLPKDQATPARHKDIPSHQRKDANHG
jgi:DNA-binding MarR family transcriptional regulator